MVSPEYARVRDTCLHTEKPVHIELAQLRYWMDSPSPVDAGTTVLLPASADGVPAEWVYDRHSDPDLRLLYLHGGGYVSGTAAHYRSFVETLSRLTGMTVLSIDYRLGPEHPFPGAVEDAVQAFHWLRANAPDGERTARRTFIAGDSAGGGLTLATLLALRDAGDPTADAAVAISAYTDLAHTGDSVRTRAAVDPISPPSWLPLYADHYLCGASPYHPLASPLYADLHALPPLLLQVGDAEIILDDSVRFAEKAREAGVDATLSVWPEMLHVFAVHLGEFPEAQAGAEEIAAYLRAHAGNPASHT